MIHQPLGGARGQATDIQIQAEQILKTKAMLNQILAENTGQSIERIEIDTERDNFLSAYEAMEYGLIGEKLGHSFSERIHSEIGLYDYEQKEIDNIILNARQRAVGSEEVELTEDLEMDNI